MNKKILITDLKIFLQKSHFQTIPHPLKSDLENLFP